MALQLARRTEWRAARPTLSTAERLWPLDTLRGAAIAGMVAYHFLWDLSFFGLYPSDVTRGAWQVVARAGGSVFLLLVGLSMNLTAARRPPDACVRQWRGRGLKLWGWALLISLVTRRALGESFVRFGILHLIGTALLLAPLLWRWRHLSGALGVALVAGGLAVRLISVDTPWLIPLGVTPGGFESVDYWPVLPWLGVVALGLHLGQRLGLRWQLLPPDLRRALYLPSSPPGWARPVCWLGRHSLLVYVVHQPLLLAGFRLFGYSLPSLP